MRIGLFGGSFNPIHNAHLHIANLAMKVAGLDFVVFIPAGDPYFKPKQLIAPKEDRIAMCELALEGHEGFVVSTMETDRQGPSYTSETIDEFANIYPAAELFIIVGEDKLDEIPRWHDVHRVYDHSKFIVVRRADGQILIPTEVANHIGFVIDNEYGHDISSTRVREAVRRGDPVDMLIPQSVASYISERNLYTE